MGRLTQSAIRNGVGICFIHEGERRYVLADEMGSGGKGPLVQAKFPVPGGGNTYNLVTWDWGKLKSDPNEKGIQQEEFTFSEEVVEVK